MNHPYTQVLIAALFLLTQIGIFTIFYKNYRTLNKIFYSNNRNLLVRQLQSENVREARHYIAEKLTDKNYKKNEWDSYDRRAASIICGAYGTIGAYLKKDKIRIIDIICYKQSILTCYDILEPYIKNRAAKRGESYWQDFQSLAVILKNTDITLH